MDIFEDSCDSLELDRIKAKVLEVWSHLLSVTYEKEYKDMSEEDDDYKTLEHYLEHHKLMFGGDVQEQSEEDELLDMLDNLLEEDEELEPVQSEGKAPKYSGSSLSSNKETSKVPSGSYSSEHMTTKTPSDSEERVKSSSYKEHRGKTLKSKTHTSSSAHMQSLEDILKIERERLLRLVAKRNKEFGVRL